MGWFARAADSIWVAVLKLMVVMVLIASALFSIWKWGRPVPALRQVVPPKEQAAQWAVDMQLKVRHIDCPNHPAGEYIRCAVLYQTAWMGLDEQKILQIECAKQGSELPAGCRLFAAPP